jgi:hypothetical protein
LKNLLSNVVVKATTGITHGEPNHGSLIDGFGSRYDPYLSGFRLTSLNRFVGVQDEIALDLHQPVAMRANLMVTHVGFDADAEIGCL